MKSYLVIFLPILSVEKKSSVQCRFGTVFVGRSVDGRSFSSGESPLRKISARWCSPAHRRLLVALKGREFIEQKTFYSLRTGFLRTGQRCLDWERTVKRGWRGLVGVCTVLDRLWLVALPLEPATVFKV